MAPARNNNGSISKHSKGHLTGMARKATSSRPGSAMTPEPMPIGVVYTHSSTEDPSVEKQTKCMPCVNGNTKTGGTGGSTVPPEVPDKLTTSMSELQLGMPDPQSRQAPETAQHLPPQPSLKARVSDDQYMSDLDLDD